MISREWARRPHVEAAHAEHPRCYSLMLASSPLLQLYLVYSRYTGRIPWGIATIITVHFFHLMNYSWALYECGHAPRWLLTDLHPACPPPMRIGGRVDGARLTSLG
jgi:hypothetical protein